MVLEEIYALGKAYPIISIIIGIILFFIGLKITGKLLKWVLFILGVGAIIAAVWMLFGV